MAVPFFSPDGQRIVWRHFEENGVIADVWTMKTDGSDKRRITDFKSMSWAPFYHPSGKYIIFTSNKFGFENFELFIVDADGEREPVRVTFTPGFDGLPVFSPDGKKLCWTSGRTSDGKAQTLPRRLERCSRARRDRACAQTTRRERAVADDRFRPEITEADLRHEVEWLADEKRDGRMTGTAGAQAAANWLADYFREAGLKSFGERLCDAVSNSTPANACWRTRRGLKSRAGASRPCAPNSITISGRLPFSENGEARAKWCSPATVWSRPAMDGAALRFLRRAWT